jgi:alpha-beta hydrolase superfamily lysophospholipase
MLLTVERFSMRVDGVDVVGVLHLPPSGPAPCVVACHGMGASKDSDKYLLLGRDFPEAGLALARFDFRGSGESGGLYHDATIASRIADLEGCSSIWQGTRPSTGASGCWARAWAASSLSGSPRATAASCQS